MARHTLLCVLDWGLGHASRSLALLDHPLLAGDEVFLASSGSAAAFLRRARPDLPLYELPPYSVRYSTANMPFNVAIQLPGWLRTIYRERRRTSGLVAELRIDRIISDNRFGCYAPGVPSIFLTHQLHPITNSRPVSWLYRRYLQRFTAFWVPDDAGRSLSGKLSRPEGYDGVKYIGLLSRFGPVQQAATEYNYVCLLSGPEPMRTRLEEQLMGALPQVPGKHVLIRGVTGDGGERAVGDILVVDFADAARLRYLLARTRRVLCRSGYSTLMDLAALGLDLEVVLVPTPGQTEQVYLGARLARVRVPGLGGCWVLGRSGKLYFGS